MIGYILLVCTGQANGTWPMWGGEPTHRATQTMAGAITTTPLIKWKFATSYFIEKQFSAIADADGDGEAEVIVGSWDRNVYCLNGADGTEEWSFSTGGYVESSPAVADVDGDGEMEVVFGCWDTYVYCLNGSDGSQEWAFKTAVGGMVYSSPAVADVDGDGNMEVVVGSNDNNLYCLDGATGTAKWVLGTGGDVRSSPAVADVDGDGNMEVVVGSNDDSLYCLDGATGTAKWVFGTGNDMYSSPAVADVDGDGNMEVVVGSNDSTIYCLNGSDGTQKWTFSTGSCVRSSPAISDVDGDGIMDIFMGCDNGSVYCLNGSDGTQKWTFSTNSVGIWGGIPLVDINGDGDIELIIAYGTNLQAIDARTGSSLWTLTGLGYGGAKCPFVGDIDGDDLAEIVVGVQMGAGDDYRLFALDNTSDVDEEGSSLDWNLTSRGQDIYLFASKTARVTLSLYDASGRLVQELYNGSLPAGSHIFVPKIRTRGVYFALLRFQGNIKALKLTR